jgi:hypothetical protein
MALLEAAHHIILVFPARKPQFSRVMHIGTRKGAALIISTALIPIITAIITGSSAKGHMRDRVIRIHNAIGSRE